MSEKVKEWKHQKLAHHSLIKLTMEDVLSQLRIHVLWSIFRDMDKEAFLEARAIEHGGTPYL